MKYKDIIGYSKPKKKLIKEQIKSQPKKKRPISGQVYYVYNGYGSEGKTLNVVGFRCSGQ